MQSNPEFQAAWSGGIVPVLRYRDVRGAVNWLCTAFGFQQHRLLEDEDGSVRYAQLACGNSMVMLCPVGGSAFDAYMAQPAEQGGFETQVCYVFVRDARAHQAQASAAGAEIVLDLDGGEGRGRGYSCRDIEGHIWSFGTYDPWRLAEAPQDRAQPRSLTMRLRKLAAVAAIVVAIAAGSAGLVGWVHGAADPGIAATLASIDDVIEKPADMDSALEMLRQVRTELARERSARMQAERRSSDAPRSAGDAGTVAVRDTCAQPTAAEMKAAAFQLAGSAPDAAVPTSIVQHSAAGAGTEEIKALKRAMEQAQEQLRLEREAREATVVDTHGVREQLSRERIARELAERQARDAALRAARIEAARRAEFVRRNGGETGTMGSTSYRDIAKIIFPPS